MKTLLLVSLSVLVSSTLFAAENPQFVPVKKHFRQITIKPLPMKDGKLNLPEFLSNAVSAEKRLGLNEKGLEKLKELKSISPNQERKLLRKWRKFLRRSVDLGSMSIEDAIQFLILEISADARADVRELLNDMDATRKKKEALREQHENQKKLLGDCAQQVIPCSNELRRSLAVKVAALKVEADTMSEMSEQQQLKLQMYLDRMEKTEEMLSNLIKKFHDTAMSIISNMK